MKTLKLKNDTIQYSDRFEEKVNELLPHEGKEVKVIKGTYKGKTAVLVAIDGCGGRKLENGTMEYVPDATIQVDGVEHWIPIDFLESVSIKTYWNDSNITDGNGIIRNDKSLHFELEGKKRVRGTIYKHNGTFRLSITQKNTCTYEEREIPKKWEKLFQELKEMYIDKAGEEKKKELKTKKIKLPDGTAREYTMFEDQTYGLSLWVKHYLSVADVKYNGSFTYRNTCRMDKVDKHYYKIMKEAF